MRDETLGCSLGPNAESLVTLELVQRRVRSCHGDLSRSSADGNRCHYLRPRYHLEARWSPVKANVARTSQVGSEDDHLAAHLARCRLEFYEWR